MKKYLLLMLFVSCLKNVNAQLYFAGTMFQSYYDVNPDTLLNYVVVPYTNETFGLNLFDDSSNDILLTARGSVSSSGSSAYLSITSLNPNVYIMFGRWDSVFVPATSNWDITKVAKPLIVTEPIDASDASWDNGMLYLTDYSGHGGGNKSVSDWVGSEKFIGIKYDNGSSISYGWIRLKCPGPDSCYVKDFSNSLVTIGEQELEVNNLQMYPNPSNGSFYLKNSERYSFDLSKFSLTNMLGQKEKCSYEMAGEDIKIIPDNNLPTGCYLFRYSMDKNIIPKKVVKIIE
ncbi:MAG: T9SS type A sorting domain-containing protein [Burkholderiales bacterium]|nr:T9SS type A sorting domain-containing protein [Bacteroidia bacterium]